MIVLQATNAGVRRPGYEARETVGYCLVHKKFEENAIGPAKPASMVMSDHDDGSFSSFCGQLGYKLQYDRMCCLQYTGKILLLPGENTKLHALPPPLQ